jgi:hypothetical protein
VRENQGSADCTAATRGLLDKLDRDAALTDFVPHDPYAAGCVIEVQGPVARW